MLEIRIGCRRDRAWAVPYSLVELQWVGDLEAAECIDDHPLLILGDDLLGIDVQCKDTLLDRYHILHERDLEVDTGLGIDTLRRTELQQQRLLRLMHGIDRTEQHDSGKCNQNGKCDKTLAHQFAPCFLLVSSLSGR